MKSKKVFRALLLFYFLVLSIIYNSCCETIYPPEARYLDTNVVKIFIPGGENSYWLYKDLYSNSIDTFYTITYKKIIQEAGKPVKRCGPPYNKKHERVLPYSETLFFEAANKTNTNRFSVTLKSYSATYIKEPIILLNNSNTAAIQFSQYIYLPQKEILNVNYTDVYMTSYSASSIGTFYFAKGVGLVEWQNSTKHYQLLSYRL